MKKKPQTPITFKLHLTNSKAKYAADLTQSDYYKFRVGDLITRQYSDSIVYEVIKMERGHIDDEQIEQWKKENVMHSDPGIRDLRWQELYKEYHKNGNFGACYITIKSILRGGKEIAKGRPTVFNEMCCIPNIHYSTAMAVTDINTLIKNREDVVTRFENQIKNIEKQKDAPRKAMESLKSYRDKKRNPVPILDEKGNVVAALLISKLK